MVKKQNLTIQEKSDCLANYIACKLMPNPKYFEDICEHLKSLLPLFLSKILFCKDINIAKHVSFCVLLGMLVKKRPDLQG